MVRCGEGDAGGPLGIFVRCALRISMAVFPGSVSAGPNCLATRGRGRRTPPHHPPPPPLAFPTPPPLAPLQHHPPILPTSLGGQQWVGGILFVHEHTWRGRHIPLARHARALFHGATFYHYSWFRHRCAQTARCVRLYATRRFRTFCTVLLLFDGCLAACVPDKLAGSRSGCAAYSAPGGRYVNWFAHHHLSL